MNLSNPSIIKEVLSKNGFSFKKSLGQNFLINPSVCPRMADEAILTGADAVIEIGPGIGVLTTELASRAKKVVAIELDTRLKPVLLETLAEHDNVEIIFDDVLNIDLLSLINDKFAGMKVAVCANLPYYITTPIIMKILESRLPITSLIVMVQKEAADRICAKVGSREAGAITVGVHYYSNPQVLFKVSSGSFMPAPKVDSAVIGLQVNSEPPVDLKDEKQFFKFVKAAFGQRRKTMVNSVSSGYNVSKESLLNALSTTGLDSNVRAESLNLEMLAKVFNNL